MKKIVSFMFGILCAFVATAQVDYTDWETRPVEISGLRFFEYKYTGSLEDYIGVRVTWEAAGTFGPGGDASSSIGFMPWGSVVTPNDELIDGANAMFFGGEIINEGYSIFNIISIQGGSVDEVLWMDSKPLQSDMHTYVTELLWYDDEYMFNMYVEGSDIPMYSYAMNADLYEGEFQLFMMATMDYENIPLLTITDISFITPVPEPATYAAIFGALALGFAAYRRRK
jgi:hypothetical protein